MDSVNEDELASALFEIAPAGFEKSEDAWTARGTIGETEYWASAGSGTAKDDGGDKQNVLVGRYLRIADGRSYVYSYVCTMPSWLPIRTVLHKRPVEEFLGIVESAHYEHG